MALTPISNANRPGLDALVYRVGTQATFLETMKARLSTIPRLASLTTRDANDPAIALLDAWATVADILTFYQERIANEGYLRTATERRSVQELARLVGYALRPGVAASVYLAYTLEKDSRETIRTGSRAQSTPGPGETLESFETGADLLARGQWNDLQPRLTRPQSIQVDLSAITNLLQPPTGFPDSIYASGVATGVKVGDPLLFVFGADTGAQCLSKVTDVVLQPDARRTRLMLQSTVTAPVAQIAAVSNVLSPATARTNPFRALASILGQLEVLPPAQATHSAQLTRTVNQAFTAASDTTAQLLVAINPRLGPVLYKALAGAAVAAPQPPDLKSVEPLRIKATPFGSNAPLKPVYDDRGHLAGSAEWPLAGSTTVAITLSASIIYNSVPTPQSLTEWSILSGITLQVELHVAQDGQPTRTARADLPSSFASVALTDQITVTIDQQAQHNGRTSINFSFSRPDLKVVVGIPSTASGYIDVSIGGAAAHRIAVDQSMTYRLQDQDLAVSYSDTISITTTFLTDVPVEMVDHLALDAQYDQIRPESWVVIERIDRNQRFAYQVVDTRVVAKAAYGISGKVTELALRIPKPRDPSAWLQIGTDRWLTALRNTTLYAQGDPSLSLAEEPITSPLGTCSNATDAQTIELDGVYAELTPGRQVIVSGERRDLGAVTGVEGSELATLAKTDQVGQLSGGSAHTVLTLAQPLTYCYARTSVAVYGNVVVATHGESRNEVLGSGDGSKSGQAFTLKQKPLTFVPAPNAAGAQSTLEVRVNEVLWHQTDSLATARPTDRVYIATIDEAGAATVKFGDGTQGARLSTGAENVTAAYRTGIGQSGNVQAKQINLLATRPLGVKAVINPMHATGGADPESRDQARSSTPLALVALDRLVSVSDYADFSRRFAGIGKASAARLSDGQRELVHVTVAGAANSPIDPSSPVARNLRQALYDYGDPGLPLQVDPVVADLLVIEAAVHILPDYLFESVAPKIRTALFDKLGFERRELGQDTTLSEVVSAIQAVAGVDFVVISTLDVVNEHIISAQMALGTDLASVLRLRHRVSARLAGPLYHVVRRAEKLSTILDAYHLSEAEVRELNPQVVDWSTLVEGTSLLIRRIEPAHLVFLKPDAPDTLLLRERTDGPA